MNQTSVVIVLGWMVMATGIGWTLPSRWRMPGVAACGAGLLLSLSWASFVFLAAASCSTYWIGARTIRVSARQGAQLRTLVIGAIVAGYLAALSLASTESGEASSLILPLGMAFYVLRLIHYTLESGRGTLRSHTLSEYLSYQFFPPTLPVGPIHRFDDFLKQLRRRRWDDELARGGLSRILSGAFKIIVLGNYLIGSIVLLFAARFAEFARPSSGVAVYAETVRYWLNIYFQFSGYSDIAIGFGALLGFRLPENFNWPIMACNIGQFWVRWHMTLAAWCRDYVYMPVLAYWRRPVLASTTSMLVLGLWHALSLHYLFWGLYHALGLIVWRRFHRYIAMPRPTVRSASPLLDTCSRVFTLHFVMFSYPVANTLTRLCEAL